MAKALGTIGKIAGVVAFAASVVATAGGTAVLGASFATIATAASLTAAAASVGAGLLAKAPPAKGSLTSTTVGGDQPMPWLIGETYHAGARQQQVGYGPTKDKVQNPYALIVDVYSGAGPVEALVACYADFADLGIPPAGGAATG